MPGLIGLVGDMPPEAEVCCFIYGQGGTECSNDALSVRRRG